MPSIALGLPTGCNWRLYESTEGGPEVFTILIEGLSMHHPELIDVQLEGSMLHFSCHEHHLLLQLPRVVEDQTELACHFNLSMGACSLSVPRTARDKLFAVDHESSDEDETAAEEEPTSSNDQGESDDDMIDDDYEALGLLAPGVAQLTKVIHIPNFVSADQIRQLRAVAARGKAEQCIGLVQRSSEGLQLDGGAWQTSYLHTGGFMSQRQPELLEQIRAAVLRVDAEHWQCLAGRDPEALQFRTIEIHEYEAGGGLRELKHYDSGSCITFDVMLSEPGKDFEGGGFVTPNKDGSLDQTVVGQGDALVFLSHKYHNVEPVTEGTRVVLVTEIWEGVEKRCAHRCSYPEDCCIPVEMWHCVECGLGSNDSDSILLHDCCVYAPFS